MFIFLILELSSQVNIHVILWLLSSLSLHPTANNFLLASSTTTTTPSVTENREEIDSAHLLTSFSQSEHEWFLFDCRLNLMLVTNFRVLVLCLRSFRNFGIGSVRRCSREKRNHKCSFWSGLGFFNQLVLLRLDWPILFSFLGDGVTTLTYLCGKLLTFRAGKRQLGKPREKWLQHVPCQYFVSAKNQENVNCLKSLERTW